MPETTGMITKSKSNNSEWYVVFFGQQMLSPKTLQNAVPNVWFDESPPENRTYLFEEYE